MKDYRRYEGLSPIYQGYLTNHLPMYYQILKEYNVEKELLFERLDNYKNDRDLYSLTDQMYPTSDFEQQYIQKTSQYLGELHRYGEDVVIGNVLHQYQHGLHGHLFHGIIRLMYAVRSSYDLLIAQALAYLSLVADIDRLSAPLQSVSSFDALFHDLREVIQEEEKDSDASTMDHMDRLYRCSRVKKRLVRVENISTKRLDIIEALLEQYNETAGFYTLHAITGLHALFELEEYIIDFDDVFKELFIAIQLFVGMDKIQDQKQETVIVMWEDIEKQFLELEDVHDIKLIFSLRQLSRQFRLNQAVVIASKILLKR
jgi:hypothetical protein